MYIIMNINDKKNFEKFISSGKINHITDISEFLNKNVLSNSTIDDIILEINPIIEKFNSNLKKEKLKEYLDYIYSNTDLIPIKLSVNSGSLSEYDVFKDKISSDMNISNRGIVNIGNTCYMNSAIQLLRNLVYDNIINLNQFTDDVLIKILNTKSIIDNKDDLIKLKTEILQIKDNEQHDANESVKIFNNYLIKLLQIPEQAIESFRYNKKPDGSTNTFTDDEINQVFNKSSTSLTDNEINKLLILVLKIIKFSNESVFKYINIIGIVTENKDYLNFNSATLTDPYNCEPQENSFTIRFNRIHLMNSNSRKVISLTCINNPSYLLININRMDPSAGKLNYDIKYQSNDKDLENLKSIIDLENIIYDNNKQKIKNLDVYQNSRYKLKSFIVHLGDATMKNNLGHYVNYTNNDANFQTNFNKNSWLKISDSKESSMNINNDELLQREMKNIVSLLYYKI